MKKMFSKNDEKLIALVVTPPVMPYKISIIFMFKIHLLIVSMSGSELFGSVQDDTSGCGEPPVDFKTKVPFWPGLSWPGQAKTELLL